jgi:FkbM family methyltransferase
MEEIPIRLLWHSVAPWVGTGYGTQTALFTRRIRDLGHDVAISAYYGLYGAEWKWQGIRCMPAYAKHYGIDVLIPHALHHFGAGVGDAFSEASTRGMIITLGDVWTFQVPLLEHMSVAAWVPVDHETIPPMTSGWFRQTGAAPIAMSRFGERMLAEQDLDPLYVPHGFDPKVFYPADQKQARERVGLPADAFVVAIVAANVGHDARKAFSEQIAAFTQLHRRHSDAVLVLHTDVQTDLGVAIPELLEGLPKTAYHYTDQYAYRIGVPASTVADIYRAADVLSNTSWGEGFGVPIIEAQAVGTPVVVSDTTAMPELVGAGWKVGGERFWHESQRAWARRPYVAGIVDAYEQAYEHARDEDVHARAWAFAQDYDADTVTERYWVPALTKLSEALEARRVERLTPTNGHRQPVRVRESDGLLWLDRGDGTDDWVAYADHEPWVRPILEGLLPAGGVLLDVGAHVGRWSLRMADRASKVVAVEANPATAATLRRHLAMNDIGNVQVVQVAAWDGRATLQLDDPNGRQDGGGTRTLPHGGHGLDVDAMPLDDSAVPMLLEDAGRLDVVKLDVEGADLHALRGMAGILERWRPALLIECHDLYGYYTRVDLERTLTDLGYGWVVAHSEPSTWMPDGPSDVVRMADYLVCRPVKVGANKEQ